MPQEGEAATGPGRLEAVRIGLCLGLMLVVLAFYGWTVQVRTEQAYSTDFVQFHFSSRFFLEGRDIYTPVPWAELGPLPDGFDLARKHKHPNLNPPFQTLLFLPFAWLSFEAAYRLWSLASLAFLGLGAVIVARLGTGRPTLRASFLGLLLLAYFPSWIGIVLGQLGHFLFLLACIAWASARTGRDRLAGLALGLSLAVKPFTGLFLILFLLQRRWRLLTWYLASFSGATIVAVVVFGPRAHLRYLEILQDVTWTAASWNASILGFATRVFGGSGNAALVEAPYVAGLIHLLAAVLGLAALYAITRTHRVTDARRRLDLGFALALPLMLLLSPLGWIYYFPYLLIPLVVVFEASNDRAARGRYRGGAVLAWLLGTVPHALVRSEKVADPALIFTYPAFYCLSLVLFAALLLSLGRPVSRRRDGCAAAGSSRRRAR
ncbi:MAG: glycosyltransferase family 87 protein [Alphaproteobacteria bacterium]|jgi:hypothetical protein|nr:glycosyltransferase family 87 protein [Alphaproteobacteria bacterium]